MANQQTLRTKTPEGITLEFPVYESARLILNEIKIEDKTSIFKIFSNRDVVKYYDLAAFDNIQQAENLINILQSRFQDGSGIRWAIRLKEDITCIGSCGFNSWNINNRSAVIGYDINRDYWGKGIATEALRVIITKAFEGKLYCDNLNRIQADTVPGNLASEKVLMKLGFKEEGIRRQSGYWKNEYHDLKCFGLLKDEFITQL